MEFGVWEHVMKKRDKKGVKNVMIDMIKKKSMIKLEGKIKLRPRVVAYVISFVVMFFHAICHIQGEVSNQHIRRYLTTFI